MKPRLFLATKAFIVYDGKLLLLRESGVYKDGTNEGKFDVPGGRLTPGERFDEALLREVKEEAGLTVEIGRPFFVNEWKPEVRGEKWQIVGIFFECTALSDKVTLSADHDAYKWIVPRGYKKENVIENLYPVCEAYLAR